MSQGGENRGLLSLERRSSLFRKLQASLSRKSAEAQAGQGQDGKLAI